MSAKIYQAPKEVSLPEFSFQNVSAWQENEKKYLAELKQYLQEIGYTHKNVGEILKFPAADGYAQYMVASMKPLMLIHLELGDAWTFPYAHLLTAKEVQQQIDAEKRLNAFLEENRKKKSQRGE